MHSPRSQLVSIQRTLPRPRHMLVTFTLRLPSRSSLESLHSSLSVISTKSAFRRRMSRSWNTSSETATTCLSSVNMRPSARRLCTRIRGQRTRLALVNDLARQTFHFKRICFDHLVQEEVCTRHLLRTSVYTLCACAFAAAVSIKKCQFLFLSNRCCSLRHEVYLDDQGSASLSHVPH